MSALSTPNAAPKRAWRDEIIAMLSLSWPMILTNLAQTAMTATDVMMMGWVSAHTLAAGALGTNLYYVPMIFGLGLMLATSPMMARELGRNKHTVREIRRTVRQGLWIAVTISIPIWLVLWNTQSILTAMGQDPALAAEAGAYVRALQWAAQLARHDTQRFCNMTCVARFKRIGQEHFDCIVRFQSLCWIIIIKLCHHCRLSILQPSVLHCVCPAVACSCSHRTRE